MSRSEIEGSAGGACICLSRLICVSLLCPGRRAASTGFDLRNEALRIPDGFGDISIGAAFAYQPFGVSLHGVRRRQQNGNSRKTFIRSEEHTSELQSPYDLVCRLLLE